MDDADWIVLLAVYRGSYNLHIPSEASEPTVCASEALIRLMQTTETTGSLECTE